MKADRTPQAEEIETAMLGAHSLRELGFATEWCNDGLLVHRGGHGLGIIVLDNAGYMFYRSGYHQPTPANASQRQPTPAAATGAATGAAIVKHVIEIATNWDTGWRDARKMAREWRDE